MSALDFFTDDPEGAAEQSTAPPWQRHLASLGPALKIPSSQKRAINRALPPRQSGPPVPPFLERQGVSPSEFERLLDPRLTEGLQLSRRQHQSAQDLVRALGLQDEVDDEPAQGLLNAAFRIIDYPRALTFNAFRALIDQDMDFTDFRQALHEREGFGEIGGLVMQEDDSGITRFWKGAGAFLGDVVTDPLMLVSFGALPAGKKMGSQLVKAAVSKRAVNLPESVLQAAQKRALQAEARAAARQQGVDLSKNMEQQIAKRFEAITTPDLVGDMAAEAYQVGSATGLREFMQSLGDDGMKLWRDLPSDMRGGLRIRIPFAREDAALGRIRKTVSIGPGGGMLAEALGLKPVVMKAHQARGVMRASQASMGFHKALNGFYGDLYGEMAADLAERGARDISGTSYRAWSKANEGLKEANQARQAILQSGSETAARVMARLDNVGNEAQVDEAWTAFNRFAKQPEELERMGLGTGLELDELGRRFNAIGDEAVELSTPELHGLGAAAEYHHLMRSLVTEAQEAGVEIGVLNNYLPLILTKQRRDMKALKKAGLARRAGKMEHGLDPSRHREMGFEMEFVTDENGVTRSALRPLTGDEVNARVKARSEATGGKVSAEPFFEEDLGVMLQQYTAAIAHITSEAKFARIIRNSGLVQDGDEVLVNIGVRNRTMNDAQQKIDGALDLLRDLPEEAGGPRLRQAVQSILSDAEAQRVTIHRMLWNPELGPEDQTKLAGDVMKAMDTWREKLMPLEDAHENLAKAQAEFSQGLTKVKEAARPDLQAGEVGQALHQLGMRPVARSDDAATQIRKVPPELRTAMAPESLRDAIHKFYQLRGPRGNDIIDRWYRPYHSMFKITATIGRGPGFHIRNAWGGTINNMMYGASPEDAWTQAKIVRQMTRAGRQARKEVAKNSKSSARQGGKIRESRSYWDDVARRTDEILEPRLKKIQVGDMDGWEFYKVMRDTPDILWGKQGRSLEALNEAGEGGLTRPDSLARAGAQDVFPGLRPDDLSIAQRGVVKLRNMWWIRANANAAEMTEAWLRGTAFMHGMKKYGDPESARLGTLVTQFDYHDLSPFEQKWMRGTLLPFYTWTRNNIPFQLRTLMQQPGRMNQLNHAVNAGQDAFGDEDSDVLPEWMKSRFGFTTRFKFGGNPLMFGIETPAQDLNEFFKVGSVGSSIHGMGRAFASAMNPAFSVPAQVAAGTEFFTGATLSEGDQRLAPRWYQVLAETGAVPQWVDPKTGDVYGDARIIVGGAGGLPWLGQGEKVLSILGAPGVRSKDYPEGRNRRVSDAIRMFFPVVTAGTLTPQSESGELFQRTRRLRYRAAREADPQEHAMVRQLQEAGLTLEQIASIMEAKRAREGTRGL